jgi:hypothetical protein
MCGFDGMVMMSYLNSNEPELERPGVDPERAFNAAL